MAEVPTRLFGFRSFNERLALLGFIGIPCLWVVNHWFAIPAEALGATISVWTLIAFHYWRKAPPENGPKP